jgi:hypothetical protein
LSSTGIISKVISGPLTTTGENTRSVERNINSIPGPYEQQRKVIGVVSKVHSTKPRLIKANTSSGYPIANGNWIELNHSAQEITERWGTVRIGFRVRVSYSGPSGQSADAIITGVEEHDIEEPHQENDAARSLYAIFTPGNGVT